VITTRTYLLIAFLLTLSLSASANGWTLKDKDGVDYSLSTLKGRWVLVNFWAPWCPSCIQEMPDLSSLQKQHKDLQVIGVAVMYKTHREVMDMAQNLPYPIVFGNEDTAGDFGGMAGLPTSFLYSPTGKLVSRYDGPLPVVKVEQAMAQK
jgi:thiol-disulfide isomerase/thioredoxin